MSCVIAKHNKTIISKRSWEREENSNYTIPQELIMGKYEKRYKNENNKKGNKISVKYILTDECRV